MLKLKTKSVIIEMDRNDLWQVGTALINGIIIESQNKWMVYYRGKTEAGFIRYVRLQHHVIFLYLEEIYSYLDRMDLLESLEITLRSLYRQKASY
ncbi:hypothetical protein [Paenibacillus sp. NPDC058174]|uniref:hypothetical protein n=1 Tax=Paenibacillus sp. NPDC058174 TaxID=3346366 RepID=UPI0036DF8A62